MFIWWHTINIGILLLVLLIYNFGTLLHSFVIEPLHNCLLWQICQVYDIIYHGILHNQIKCLKYKFTPSISIEIDSSENWKFFLTYFLIKVHTRMERRWLKVVIFFKKKLICYLKRPLQIKISFPVIILPDFPDDKTENKVPNIRFTKNRRTSAFCIYWQPYGFRRFWGAMESNPQC